MADARPPAQPAYDLFISYARRDARRRVGGRAVDIVARFKRALEAYRHPGDRRSWRARRFRVCTDREDLELAATVSDAIRAALDRSRALLLVCSTHAPQSRYVQEEVAYFKRRRGAWLIPAYLDLPPEAVVPGLFASGSLGVDLAPTEGASLKEWQGQLEDEARKLVALVWDVPTAHLRDRFEAERRAQRRIVIGLIAAGLVLTCVGVFGTAARFGLHRVEELPLANRAVAPAGVGFLGSDDLPYLADDGVLQVWAPAGPRVYPLPEYASEVYPVDGARLLVVEPQSIVLVEPLNGASVHLATSESSFAGSAVRSDGFAAATEEGELLLGDFTGHFERAPRPVITVGRRFPPDFQETGPLSWGELLAWSADGGWLASATLDGRLYVFDAKRRVFLNPQDPLAYETENTRPIGALVFLEKLGKLLFSEGSSGLRELLLENGEVRPVELPPLPLVRELLRHPDGRRLVGVSSETLEVFALDGTELEWKERVPLGPKNLPRIAWSPSGAVLLVGYFDAPPDLFRFTIRAFSIDLWW